MMKKSTYTKLREKMVRMKEEKIAIRDQEIKRIQDFIDSIDALFAGDEKERQPAAVTMALMVDQKLGITDAVRTALFRNQHTWLSPMRVRTEAELLGLELDEQPNPMASIHTILKRLFGRGEIDQKIEDGKTFYRWIPVEQRKTK